MAVLTVDRSAAVLRRARREAGLSLRQLAVRAGTSHATLAAYEHGRVTPGAETLERILAGAGFALDFELSPRRRDGLSDDGTKGAELEAVLELAAAFPARHAPTLGYPRFGRQP